MIEHLRRAALDRRVREHVRVPAHELVADGRDDVVGPERALAARQLGLEHHLKEQVSELGAELLLVAVLDRVDDLARLFEDEASQRIEALLAVPRTPVGREQPLHQLDGARERGALLFGERRRHDGREGARHRARLCLNRGVLASR